MERTTNEQGDRIIACPLPDWIDERGLDRLADRLAQKLEPALRHSVMVARSDGAMMSIAEICAYMNLSRTQFYFLRRGEIEIDGEPLPPFPEPRRHGGNLVWRRRDVDEWLDACPRGCSTDQSSDGTRG